LIGQAVRELLALEERWSASPSPVWGLPTGFTSLDLVTGGLQPDELTVLAARPSIGKTSLAIQIAFSVACTFSRRRTKGRSSSSRPK